MIARIFVCPIICETGPFSLNGTYAVSYTHLDVYKRQIISYDPVHEDAFSTFVKTIGNELGKGIRPALDLGNSGISRVLESKGAWVPTGRVPLPKLKKGSAFIKTERTTTDKPVSYTHLNDS